ncbi:putative palmitoyl acyltransferase 6 [Leptomonas pyrrhocoris]|uniref:Palmitoyltransferase n=1 Tax=Leptomonas pyrrhocoris TaxID=157538 RepID=A0A0M9FUW1_LEPPY|nr:putative palmitoyl acyltransferase 6 [Leptomonas pyrrhocoris]KPA76503.1 putative palmitoyl acyltransferase 6 [Leptomonas pyrrhocoris]|eukprot:XP_015654942.1 putative palmitoyl acyltransferase 6 [Leptomonas pyrrhocoris]
MNANEPRTNNPGLGSYVGRTAAIVTFLAILFFFTAVHFYYATSALLDVLALFILFIYLFFLGLSMGCLVLCARIGPGDLPSRFSAARMETFIRDELQRIVAKARPARGAEPDKAVAKIVPTTEDTAADAPSPSTTADAAQQKRRWQDVDDEEEHQLANVASTAALTQRASPTAAEAELAKRAIVVQLRMHEERATLSSNEAEEEEEDEEEGSSGDQRRRRRPRHPRPHEGDGIHQEDGAIHNSADDEVEVRELPAYMPEMMELRRQRKILRGLEAVRVSEAAQRVLEAVDSGDFDRKREEMGYLIPGANWCRFCSYYQMNDTRHCTVCGRCVYRSKLHCVCCGKCIGYANSKYYVLFLFYLALAFLMANFLDIYCISWGYTYFFKPTGESNSIYYLVFVYSYAILVVVVGILVQYLLAAGRNVGLLTALLREQREELEGIQLRNSGERYQMVMSERTAGLHDDGRSSPEQTREPFIWRRAMDTVGEGLSLPLWFWPVPTRPAVQEMADPEGFWPNLKEAIRIRLRSVADEDDVFTEEDEVMGHEEDHHSNDANHISGVTDERVPSAASRVRTAAATAAAAVPPPAATAPAATPSRGKSADVTVVPVEVAVPPPAVFPAEPSTRVAAVGPAVESAVSRPSATSPALPATKAAPAPRKKVD